VSGKSAVGVCTPSSPPYYDRVKDCENLFRIPDLLGLAHLQSGTSNLTSV
jgi:hypothetical protein